MTVRGRRAGLWQDRGRTHPKSRRMIRRLAALAAALLLACSFARAADPGTIDYSDLWWNPAENGWGVAIQRQGAVLFVAVYHYAADGTPTWYFASDVQKPDFSAGPLPWTGKLYRATGPAFSQPFNTAPDIREAGQLALDFLNPNVALLTYSAEGVTVSKQIERLTFRVPPIAGSYYGGLSTQVSRCSDPNLQGPFDFVGPLTVTESGDDATLRVSTTAFGGLTSSCTFNGKRRQAGRSGALEGTYTCNLINGSDDRGENIARVVRNGSFVMERMTVAGYGFSSKFVSVDQDCTYSGQFGGVKSAVSPLGERSGFWSSPGEAGWGVYLAQQGETGFLTIYVFDAAGRPTFFVASDMTVGFGPADGIEFHGPLYRTAGTPRGAPYDASRFHADRVGIAAFTLDSLDRATLTYTVGDTVVNKSLRREVWRPTVMTGSYKGGLFVSTGNCTAGLGLPTLSYPGSIQVSQSGDQVTLDTAFEPGFAAGGTCRYVGRVQQLGSVLGITQGTYGCEFTDGVSPVSGTFEVTQLQVAESGFSGRYRGIQGTCVHNGQIGGIVRGSTAIAPAAGE
jgi:hypothetical protein